MAATVRSVLKLRLAEFFFDFNGLQVSDEKIEELMDLIFSAIGIPEKEQNEKW
jgi:hypothetical protein